MTLFLTVFPWSIKISLCYFRRLEKTAKNNVPLFLAAKEKPPKISYFLRQLPVAENKLFSTATTKNKPYFGTYLSTDEYH
jgi:hypothetical protein